MYKRKGHTTKIDNCGSRATMISILYPQAHTYLQAQEKLPTYLRSPSRRLYIPTHPRPLPLYPPFFSVLTRYSTSLSSLPFLLPPLLLSTY